MFFSLVTQSFIYKECNLKFYDLELDLGLSDCRRCGPLISSPRMALSTFFCFEDLFEFELVQKLFSLHFFSQDRFSRFYFLEDLFEFELVLPILHTNILNTNLRAEVLLSSSLVSRS